MEKSNELKVLDRQLLSSDQDIIATANQLADLQKSTNKSALLMCLLVEARLRVISVLVTERTFEKRGIEPDADMVKQGKSQEVLIVFRPLSPRACIAIALCTHSSQSYFVTR